MKTPPAKDVDSYIADSNVEARPILEELRELIKATIPQAEESISYSVPIYKYQGMLVGLAVYKNHVSFGFGADVIEDENRTKLEAQGYKITKGTLQIKFEQEVPTAAVQQILKAKARMNEAAKER
ncbi:DUF1801 domain-containing protein [bacterium]|nr:MAG: DUF1801 domain-containing protein [bacterium]